MKGLIFYNGQLLERSGGPSTYLYNLRIGFHMLGYHDISFFTQDNLNAVEKNVQRIFRDALLKLGIFFPESISTMYTNLRTRHKYTLIRRYNGEFDFVHFHKTADFIQSKEVSARIKILTTHSPVPPHLEIEDYIANKYGNIRLAKFFREAERKIDEEAFIGADVLMFPSMESLEGYFETWPEFQNIIKNKKILFVPSGSLPLKAKEKPNLVRKRYNIPDSAFVVSYVGRHHPIKGYDILQEAAKYLWNRGIGIYFLIAGNQWPMKGLSDERWIEVGWTEDPGSYINSSDIFVLPNRITHFDLVLMEVLSLGKPIIASNAGGNKFVAKQSEGVILFQSGDYISLAEKILEAYESRIHLEELGDKNLQLYLSFYTPDKFALRYIQSLKELLGG